MPVARFQMPDGRIARFEVPEGTTPEQAQSMITAALTQVEKPDPYAAVAAEQSGMENFVAGTGGAMKGLALGLGQRLGVVDQATIDEHKKAMEGLKTTTGGTIGAVFGEVAPAAAASMIAGPGYLGAVGTGALLGAATPTSKDESAVANTLSGAAGGAAGQFIGNKIAGAIARSGQKGADLAAKNAVRDATLAESQAAGYVVPPSMAGAGMGSRVLEGVSGKYKTNQLAGIRNQEVTNTLAKKALGIPDNQPLSVATVEKVREAAYAPYKEIAGLPVKETKAATSMFSDWGTPGQASKGFNPKQVLEDLKQARNDAKGWFEAYNRSASPADLAKARELHATAESLESSLEGYAKSMGRDDLIPRLAEARKMIAKTYTVERALQKSTGNLDAKTLGRLFEKQKPLSDGLDTIGKFGSAFRDVAGVPQSGHANPFTVLDMFSGGLGYGVSPAVAALPLARVAARYGILNPAYQSRFVNPKYGMPLLEGIAPSLQRTLPLSGGLLGVELAQQ